MKKSSRAAVRLLWVAFLLFGIFGPGLACSSLDAPAPSPAASSTNRTTVTASIGTGGGTLEHPGGAKIVVPPGALSAATTIAITGIDAPSAEQLRQTALGQGFQMEPEGLVFSKPASIVLAFDAARMPAGANVAQVEIYTAPKGTTEFAALPSTAELATGKVTAETMHFSTFVAAQNQNPTFITTKSPLPRGTVGASYSARVDATGGTPPYRWSIAPGGNGLPVGLAFGADGTFSGTPAAAGTFDFNVLVADSGTNRVQRSFSIAVDPAANPAPTLSDVTPAIVNQGSADTTITLTGAGFVPSTFASVGGVALATTYVSATQLTAIVPKAQLSTPGQFPVVVTTPPPGGGSTNGALMFTVVAVAQNPVPTLSAIEPAAALQGAADTQITLTGTNFIAESKAVIGQQQLSTVFVSATELAAIIPASFLTTAGKLAVAVANPAPGGGTSTALTFTVGSTNPTPTLTSLSPSQVDAGSAAFTLTLTGTNFVAGGQAFFGATALTTTVASATSATAAVPASLVTAAGKVDVTFVNPAPGGGASSAVTFTVVALNPVPTLATIAPTQVTAGAASFRLDLTGTNFVNGGIAYFGGTALTTTVVSASAANASVPANLVTTAGSVNVTFVNPTPGGGASNAIAFTISPPASAPTIASLTPSSARTGSADLTVQVWSNSPDFISGAVVYAGAVPLATMFGTAYSLYATIPSTMLSSAANLSITAKNPGGTASNALAFNVAANGSALPTLSSVSPSTAAFGSAATAVTLTGTNFVTGSRVLWRFAGEAAAFDIESSYGQGSSRPQVVNATTITISLPAILFATAGPHEITVVNPAPGGGSSAPVTFAVSGTNPVPNINGVSPSTVGTGTDDIPLTINGTKPGPNFVSRTSITVSSASIPTTEIGKCGTGNFTCTVTLPKWIMAQATTLTLAATSPAPGGGTGQTTTITVASGNPTPQVTSISPATLTLNAPGQPLTLFGKSFIVSTTVRELQSNTFLTVTNRQSTSLTVDVPAALLDGTYNFLQFEVANPAPGGGTWLSAAAAVQVGPWITATSPEPLTKGTAFTMTITGTGLDLNGTATVGWDGVNAGSKAPTTKTATTWTVDFTAADFPNAGTQNFWITIGSQRSNMVTVTAQ